MYLIDGTSETDSPNLRVNKVQKLINIKNLFSFRVQSHASFRSQNLYY